MSAIKIYIGAGGKTVLPSMWPVIGPSGRLVDGSLVVTLEQTRSALKLLATRAHVIAEGAGALPVAAAMYVLPGVAATDGASVTAGAGATPTSPVTAAPVATTERRKKVVCVISGGNIDLSMFSDLMLNATVA
jgi:threonine dehydratase